MRQHKSKKFLCRYYHDGSEWALTLDAYDLADAEVRCKKLGLNLDGEIMAIVPAMLGPIPKLVCWMRNQFAF